MDRCSCFLLPPSSKLPCHLLLLLSSLDGSCLVTLVRLHAGALVVARNVGSVRRVEVLLHVSQHLFDERVGNFSCSVLCFVPIPATAAGEDGVEREGVSLGIEGVDRTGSAGRL
jgi:hypothetical protein